MISEMRQAGQFVPTLILTARGHPDDVLRGFAAGADDYLTKPFELSILIARIRRPAAPARVAACARWHRRRQSAGRNRRTRFTFGDKSVHFDRLELHVRDQVFPLTLMEANVLRYLIDTRGPSGFPGRPCSPTSGGLHEDTDTRAIDNFIVRLRRYIEDDPARPGIC